MKKISKLSYYKPVQTDTKKERYESDWSRIIRDKEENV